MFLFHHVWYCAARRTTIICFGIVSCFFFRFCYSLLFVIFSLIILARSKLVHKKDLESQHHNWPLICPLLVVLCEQVKAGTHPPAENCAIVMEILDKKGILNLFIFLFIIIFIVFSVFADVFRHVIKDEFRKQLAYSYNHPIGDPNRQAMIVSLFNELSNYLAKYWKSA